ncbi:MAG: tRNA pseudouridine(38-40) synthase TruA [Waddliaceae bacterium]
MGNPSNPQSYKYKLTLAYDGTNYSGWQIQPNALTIQEILQDKLEVILRTKTTATGAGRTDAGVHAVGQVAHFSYSEKLDLFRFLASINGLLPKDIRVKKAESVPEDFHARYSVINKAYHYHLNLGFVQDPFTRLYSWHITGKINLDVMRECAKLFVGTHDFTSFANEPNAGAVSRNPVRTLKRLDIIPEKDGIRLEFESESFLYKMVRNITGVLVEVALGKRDLQEVSEILEAKDRRKGGRAAPPQGLFLMHVDYANSDSSDVK